MFKDVKQLATPKAVRVIGFFFLTYYSVNFSNEGDFSFCPGSLVGVQIIPYFVHEINRYLSSQSKGISVFVHGCYSCVYPRQ